MADFSLEWTGSQVISRVQSTKDDALRAGATPILEDAQRRTPTDHGDLRESGRVDIDGDEALISFDTPYAVTVHEDLEASHDDGEAKFLERALSAKRDVALNALAVALRKVLR